MHVVCEALSTITFMTRLSLQDVGMGLSNPEQLEANVGIATLVCLHDQ